MDWEKKYLEKLESELSDLRQHLNSIEHKINENLERNMIKILASNRERHQEYLSLHQRLDAMSGKVDRAVQWNVKLSVSTFIVVAGLVIALVTKIL